MDVTDLDLQSRLLGGLPLVNVFYDRLGIDRLLEQHVPDDPRLRVIGWAQGKDHLLERINP